jgi:hypothetical protein
MKDTDWPGGAALLVAGIILVSGCGGHVEPMAGAPGGI